MPTYYLVVLYLRKACMNLYIKDSEKSSISHLRNIGKIYFMTMLVYVQGNICLLHNSTTALTQTAI